MEIALKFALGLFTADSLLYTALFTVPFALILTVLCTFFKKRKINRIISAVITAILCIWYNTQMVYYNVFGTFLVIKSITNGGTEQAFNSTDMIISSITSKLGFILLVFVPLIVNIIFGGRLFAFTKIRLPFKGIVIIIAAAVYGITLVCVNLDSSSSSSSSYNLYYGELQQNAVCERFGLFTMQRLDISHLLFGYSSVLLDVSTADEAAAPTTSAVSTEGNESGEEDETVEIKPQIIETDFEALSESTDNDELKTLYNYFSSAEPSYTNEYTGMFEGYNIIFITAESFSKYAIDEELTPTLYKLYNEGFQFENYYSPAWGVSTTDGEYANLTGLIPKSGVWSFSQSVEDNISFPFTLGEMSHTYSYSVVNAYHNHTYSYYDRDQYLTNIGYDYFAIGKGLDLGENVWPNSDYKMMQKTVNDYINADSFSVYYMTVSGHGSYSYNTMSIRNWDAVEDLDYDDEVKGYLVANIELDKAMEYLLERLEEAGKLDNTLICMTDDHYPYALDDVDGLDELAGHEVDTTFERYENAWILWSGSMAEPIKVDTYCSSLDVLPTLLNMLGFEYDSRTLSGTDVFGSKAPFVVFADRSWISQNGKYNANTGTYTEFEDAEGEDDIESLSNRCNNMFTVARMILDNDAYAQMYGSITE